MSETVTEIETGAEPDAGDGGELAAEARRFERSSGGGRRTGAGRTVTVVKSRSAGPELRTPLGTAPILPLLMIGLGAYLLWFMSRYWRGSGPAVWPSYPIKSVLQGKGLPPPQPAPASSLQVTTYEQGIQAQVTAASQPPAAGQGGGAGEGSGGPLPTGSAQNMAKLLLGRYGFGPSEMGPLILLWNRESGWNPNARNGSSGAYGIAQALGHGTSCSAAANGTNEYGPEYGLSCTDARAANGGSAVQQIRWGLGYIKSRYGSPSAAWSHETQFGWYHEGGYIPAGQTGVVGEQGAEEVTAGAGGATVVPRTPGTGA